jgi:hypothetical protein
MGAHDARKEQHMSHYLFGCIAAGMLAGSAAIAAPEPQYPPPKASTPAAQPAQMATVEGCIAKEEDVPGRKPNVAERAGVLEDYILTQARVVKGSAPGSPQAKPGETPTGTSGAQTMYEIEGITDERLKQLVGKRVQIEGRFENVDRAQARPESRTPADDLVEIRGTTIREVSGDCQKKQ